MCVKSDLFLYISIFDLLTLDCYYKIYSNGCSEVIIVKAIKRHNLPRDEIVVMTRVCVLSGSTFRLYHIILTLELIRIIFTVGREYALAMSDGTSSGGYVNQHGLSRKVGDIHYGGKSAQKLKTHTLNILSITHCTLYYAAQNKNTYFKLI